MKTILLKFAGPLQSWGTSSHFETRHTDFYPSKSAVIGMIAASLGYRRNEDEKIRKLNELDFAVRVDQQGNLLRDWHNAKSDKRKDPYTTNRYYLEDAVFVVAISHQNYAFIQMIEDGLRSPYFQPFMGRRACPLPVDFIVQVTNDSALDSLKQLDWQAAAWYMKRQSTDDRISLEIYTDSYLTGKESYQLRQDKVLSFSQKERKFGFRYESRVRVEVLNPLWQEQSSTEHDIFNSIGD
ncbi:type I-E CRISPR-associated protein Cas5/CasD [Streptococcus mutans]|uniref:type I-E CRISPR-associated protein Cas5/CasD n=1 Tax=Streptococcus mutans TaxID=1309 RepID=UPI00081BDC4B|nr:type I-E CRISPR-associated protein Cas5/CasD [Streptococcus mutans]MCB5151042.1 type I-E CRISPR-associated protein Cas5/CasD [Streptococcus mutans]NLQ80904.1 type I-E CRISPR-associated protein Cas5/CasD [Streptococcus mutans]